MQIPISALFDFFLGFFGYKLASGTAYFIDTTLGIFVMMLVILVSVAFLVLWDRKIWASVQLRKGPNVVGPFGTLQLFADFIKFAVKEVVVPASADKFVFLFAPLLMFVLGMAAWAVIPVTENWVFADLNIGILYIFAISSLGVYGIIMGGWASNSKYPFLGSLRSAAQMVSYEVSIGFVIITVVVTVGSLKLSDIVRAQEEVWYAFTWLFPMFIVFFISALAETNRPPFDLPEAEPELVAGYQSEYSSTPYMMFMMSEYVSIVLMCAMTTILFLGGWLPPWPFGTEAMSWLPIPPIVWFVLKVLFVFFMFAMVKAFVPRYRYDQLMRLGWKIFLPFSLVWVALSAAIVVYFPDAPGVIQGQVGP